MTGRRVFSAGTSFPNTPESDRMPEVWHDVWVKLEDGRVEVTRVMAEAPDAALAKVRSMPDEEYAKLERIPWRGK